MKMLNLFVITTVLAAMPACSKKTDEGKGGPTPTTEVTPPANASADFVSVFGSHKDKKPDDPVEVKFDKFAVTKAKFDPKNLEGGTATIEIDLASLHTPSAKRDGHLKSPAYIDLAKFTTATIDVDNVKKKDDTHYTADANVKFHGVEKKYPVSFEVVASTPDSVRIKGEQAFDRKDFAFGKDPSDQDESIAESLTIKMQLTLKNT